MNSKGWEQPMLEQHSLSDNYFPVIYIHEQYKEYSKKKKKRFLT